MWSYTASNSHRWLRPVAGTMTQGPTSFLLEICKTTGALKTPPASLAWMYQDFHVRRVNDIKIGTLSALAVDAKALDDSLKAEVPQLQGDKTTKVEVMVTEQKMIEMNAALRWASSEDGVTKTAALHLMAGRLRTH